MTELELSNQQSSQRILTCRNLAIMLQQATRPAEGEAKVPIKPKQNCRKVNTKFPRQLFSYKFLEGHMSTTKMQCYTSCTEELLYRSL